MSSFARVSLTSIASLALLLLLQSSATADTVKKWDQAAVTKIGRQLTLTSYSLYTQAYEAPESFGPGMDEDDSPFGFMDELRRVEAEARHLADSLRKGAGMKATKGSVEEIKELNDDLAEDQLRMNLETPVKNDFAAFEKLINQLLPYYGLHTDD